MNITDRLGTIIRILEEHDIHEKAISESKSRYFVRPGFEDYVIRLSDHPHIQDLDRMKSLLVVSILMWNGEEVTIPIEHRQRFDFVISREMSDDDIRHVVEEAILRLDKGIAREWGPR